MKAFLDIVLGITAILGPIVVFEWVWCWRMIYRGDPPNAYDGHRAVYAVGALLLAVLWIALLLAVIIRWIWQHA